MLHKDGDKNDPSKCRPIYTLPMIPKALEGIIHITMIHFSNEYSHPLNFDYIEEDPLSMRCQSKTNSF